jgi:DNA polymerase alpha subunit B
VSNPCTLKINEIVVGVTSLDPLASLNSSECSKDINRMARMAQHLIQQQSYAPVFPPPDNINVDLRHIDKFKMPVTPDVLLIPSKLAPFAKEIQGSLVINSGTLSKGSTGGTFAMITVHPIEREVLEKSREVDGKGKVLHKVVERARVQVTKI